MSDRQESTPPEPDSAAAVVPGRRQPDPDRRAELPDVLHGYQAAGAVLRATCRVSLRESDAQQLEQLADQLEGARDVLPYDYVTNMLAAATDLLNVAAYLAYWADGGGDGVERREIPVAAVALEIVPEVERLAERLIAAANAAGAAP
jgi:hypothetical protein